MAQSELATAKSSPETKASPGSGGGTTGSHPSKSGLRSMGGGYAAQAAALSPMDLGAMPDVSLAGNGAAPGANDAGAIAQQGFTGQPAALPHRAEMERSFGRDFSGIEAYTGPAAAAACDAIGANAYAAGGKIAFKDANPSPSLVAHELTHTLEQGGGVKAKNGDATAVNTGGEATAEAVEAAVAGGGNASDVIDEMGIEAQGGIQRSVNVSMTGAPLSFGLSDANQLVARRTVLPLLPRRTIPTPPFCASPPMWLQLVLQASAQIDGAVRTNDDSTSHAGLRLVGDCNLEVAGGIPEIISMSGGAGLRLAGTAGIDINSDTWRIDGGTLRLTGALIVALNLGPQAMVRFEYRAGESELLVANLAAITPEEGLTGMTLEPGAALRGLVETIEDLHARADELIGRFTEPVMAVIQAGQDIAEVLDCLGGGIGLGIAEALDGPTYSALYNEQTLVAQLSGCTVGAAMRDQPGESAADAIITQLWNDCARSRPRRRPGTPIDVLELIAWDDRVSSKTISDYSAVMTELRALSASGCDIDVEALSRRSATNFLWDMEREGIIAFRGNPNDTASAVVTPIVEQMSESISQSRQDHDAQCGVAE